LIACVRDALHDRPPPVDMAEPQWPLLDRTAREQCVDIFLFPWLAAHYPEKFSLSSAHPDSVPGAWRCARPARNCSARLCGSANLPLWRQGLRMPDWIWPY
jgi:hypothetical protein